MDVLVRWEDTGHKNVVELKDLKLPSQEKLRIGLPIKMWWKSENKWWGGVILDFEERQSSVCAPDSDDDIPLSKLAKKITSNDYDSEDSDKPLATIKKNLENDNSSMDVSDVLSSDSDSSSDPVYVPNSDELITEDEISQIGICDSEGCISDVFAACARSDCQKILCFTHFENNDSCKNHSVLIINDISEKETVSDSVSVTYPEQFEVEGFPKQPSGMSPLKRENFSEKERLRKLCKENRNSGYAYISVQVRERCQQEET